MSWQAVGAVMVLMGAFLAFEIVKRAAWRGSKKSESSRVTLLADVSLLLFVFGTGFVYMLPDSLGSSGTYLKLALNIIRFAAAGTMIVFWDNSSLVQWRPHRR